MPPKLGILAGGGELPARIVERCRETGREFFVIAFRGHTEPRTVSGAPHAWVRVGAAGKALTHLREARVEELVLAGPIRRPSLRELRPDGWAAAFLARSGAAALGDGRLLAVLVKELETREGFSVVGAEALLPDFLADEGVYGVRRPDDQARDDVGKGIEAAHAIGARDIGQAAVVHRGRVLALEDAAGTDAMLARLAEERRPGAGGVLVKVQKPGQESRADLPTIGVPTVEKAERAGLAGIAVEAGGALVLDREKVVEVADRLGLFVMGVPVGEGT